jgi:hypothetical protein
MTENVLSSFSTDSIKKLFSDIELEEVTRNAEDILNRIKAVLKSYASNGQPCPSCVCMTSEGVYNSKSGIHPTNLRLLRKNGFRIYKVIFTSELTKNTTFKEYITWDNIDFNQYVYVPLYVLSNPNQPRIREKTEWIEVIPTC